MNKEEKAAYMKKWRQEHPERVKEQRQRYEKKHKDKIKGHSRIFYQRHKARLNAINKAYYAAHRDRLNELARKRHYNGKAPSKPYTFYRDFIRRLQRRTDADQLKVWKFLLNCNLTKIQRNLVIKTMEGKTQKEISRERKLTQSTICKTWNGNYHFEEEKFHGGIYAKFLRKISDNKEMQEYLKQLNLLWYKGNEYEETKQKRSLSGSHM